MHVATEIRPGMEVAGLSDIGCQRENNEDSYGYWEPKDDAAFARIGRLAIVADGMGGAEGGQHASRMAVDTARDVYFTSGVDDPQQRLIEAFRAANAAVLQRARKTPSLHGMGTTLTACAVVSGQLHFAHVGDSRLYLVRNGEARQLTRDHSLVARLVEGGTIRAEDAEHHPQKNVLTAAIGVTDELQSYTPDAPMKLEPGDTVVVCTDGLWGQVTPTEIAEAFSEKRVTDACRALVRLALDRGGPDNITVQALRLLS